jgi:O-acetyl-ADP-ribose deacetylase
MRALLGDITKLAVDAIVNAAPESLEIGGGVNGAIHRAAGAELLAECRSLGGCKEGYAKITKGAGLPAKYVIHTVGPIWAGGAFGEAELLASCYRRSLQVAEENGIESIAFPSIGAGVHGFEIRTAARIAISTVSLYLSHASLIRDVIFCCFSAEDLAVYERILGRPA